MPRTRVPRLKPRTLREAAGGNSGISTPPRRKTRPRNPVLQTMSPEVSDKVGSRGARPRVKDFRQNLRYFPGKCEILFIATRSVEKFWEHNGDKRETSEIDRAVSHRAVQVSLDVPMSQPPALPGVSHGRRTCTQICRVRQAGAYALTGYLRSLLPHHRQSSECARTRPDGSQTRL